jgi:hypothetical protein
MGNVAQAHQSNVYLAIHNSFVYSSTLTGLNLREKYGCNSMNTYALSRFEVLNFLYMEPLQSSSILKPFSLPKYAKRDGVLCT